MKRDALLNLPNSISLSRLILALLFVLMDGRWERTFLIVAAGVTDILDGWFARIGNSSSVAGALIDPFADRVFVLRDGKTVAELGRGEISEPVLMNAMAHGEGA